MEKMILEVKEVSAVRKKFRLQNISFSLPEGYIMGLMGKNGAGKTTLLKCIANGKSRYQGDILVADKNCHSNPLWTGNKIAYLTEESRFFHEETLERNAKVFGLFYENFSLEEWKEAMERIELSGKRVYGRLSRGEKIKFHLAFAMAYQPSLYLLDEVTAGMDPVFRAEFFQLLHKIVEHGGASILMTSHLMEEMELKTDYLGLLEEGSLRAFGETPDILTAFKAGTLGWIQKEGEGRQ